MPTIRDVAERAGVSKATVSYVLNGRQTRMRIPEVTSERVLQSARDLGYHRNAVARSLAHKRTETIAVVMQFPAVFSGWSGFTNEMMHGVTDAAIELGYDVLLHTTQPSELWEREGASGAKIEAAQLTDGRADGALLLRDVDDPLPAELRRKSFPTVSMFVSAPESDAWFVDCDNALGAKLAMEHLIGLGHRRIVHLAGSSRSGSASDRRRGYCAALEAAGIPVYEEWIIEARDANADMGRVAAVFSGSERTRPTALFSWSDDVAIRAISALRGIGLTIPQDIAIVGFDSTATCNFTDPPLTSIRQPVYDMANRAFHLLVKQIQGETVENHRQIVLPVLDVRGSCGRSRSEESVSDA